MRTMSFISRSQTAFPVPRTGPRKRPPILIARRRPLQIAGRCARGVASCDRATRWAPAPSQAPPPRGRLRRVATFSVLIVDDEKNIRHTLRVCLETMDTTVVEAASAQAALDAMARAAFDLVFLDLRLGQESGLDLIPRLLGENPNVVIVVVTAYAT